MKDKLAKAVLAMSLATAVMAAWILFWWRDGGTIFQFNLIFIPVAGWVAWCVWAGIRWKRTLMIMFLPWGLVELLLYALEVAGILRQVWLESSLLLVIGFIVWGVTWGAMDSPHIQKVRIRHASAIHLIFRVIPTYYLVACVLAIVCITQRRDLPNVFLLEFILRVVHMIHGLSGVVVIALAPVWLVLVLLLPSYLSEQI